MNNTEKKGRIHTFWTLIQENPIIIPKVQRDYAYGRTDEKATEVRQELLANIKTAIISTSGEDKMTMDFIYGSMKPGVGMEPLDGQQRLTTLFLLHVYAAQREGLFPDELLRFTYATRMSAKEFCKKMVKGAFYEMDEEGNKVFDWTKKPSCQIVNSNAYLPTYNEDPTIVAMFVVLDEIQAKFATVENLWSILINTDKIRFYYLPLEKFGLSDDLYIKMNSRGKPLTEYELFKSKFEGYIEERAKVEKDIVVKNKWFSAKEDLSHKLDGSWMDMLWKNADRKVENVDNGFINFFHAIIQIRYCLNNDDCSITDRYCYENTMLECEDLDFLISFFNAFDARYKNDSFDVYWDSFFYTSTDILGENDKIRLFGRAKENIFITAIRGKLTNADYVLLYAVYLGLHHQINEELFGRFRVLRNLLVNSPYELRGKKIRMMLLETKNLILEGKLPTQGFNVNQMEEESIKTILEPKLLRYENHEILRGTLLLFLRNEAISLLDKFEIIFNENYAGNTPVIRAELLKWGDYSQYTKNMDTNSHKRYFVHKPQIWRDFFTISSVRHNQDEIINCLSKCADTVDLMNDKSSQYSCGDWQYYLINYDIDSWAYEYYSQGVYNWDDAINAPLVINMLNSSSHNANSDNSGYIEWNLLNRIYSWKYWNVHSLLIDKHGSAEVTVVKANLSITAIKQGWLIREFDGLTTIIEKLISDGFNIRNNVYIVNDTDYILEAERLVRQIETYL